MGKYWLWLSHYDCSKGEAVSKDKSFEEKDCPKCKGLGMVEDFDGYGYQLIRCQACGATGSVKMYPKEVASNKEMCCSAVCETSPKPKSFEERVDEILEQAQVNPDMALWARKDILALVREEVEKCIPIENSYGKGLVEQIGSLLMGNTAQQMSEGFKEYKQLKAIERERNFGWNECIRFIKQSIAERMGKP